MAWSLAWLLSASASFMELPSRCDLPRVNGSKLTWEELHGFSSPILVYGLGLPELPLQMEEMVQVSNGRNEQGQRRYRTMHLADYVRKAGQMKLEEDGRSTLPTIFLSDLLTPLQRRLWADLELPELMQGFARPILSIGVKHSGEDFHSHEETWLWLAQGRKAWWLSNASLASLRHLDPCNLSAQLGLFCVQEPGEAIFFRTEAHATCNLEPLVLGVGAQGRHGTAPLLLAARSGHLARLEEALRQKQADASDGRSALHAAAAWGHGRAVTRLLEAGRPIRRDGEGLEPIHIAALHGHVEVVRLLRGFSRAGGLLARAATQGHVSVMELLLASDMGESKDGALHAAAKGGHLQALDFLLKRKAGLNSRSPEEQLTPLHFAASMGHAELVRHLLALGASTLQDHRQLLPIHLAVHADSVPVLRELLGHPASRAPKDLLHFAAEGGRLRALQFLLAHRDVEAQDGRGFQALHLASLAGHGEALRLLARQNAQVQAQGQGFGAAHFAAKGGHVSALRVLLELGAPLGRARDGSSVLDVAQRVGHQEVVNFLRKGKGRRNEL